MNIYYTYAYLREDGTPYYIGKGSGNRINGKHRKNVKVPPKEKRIYLKKNLTEEEAFMHERYMIFVFGRKDLGTGILINMTSGGEGTTNISEKTREKIKKSSTKYKTEEEKILAISKSRKKYYQKNKEKISLYYKERWKNILSKNENMREEMRRKNRIPKHLHKTNKLWKTWRITFEDGKIIEMTGLYNFCKENGYSNGLIYQVAKGTRKKHKDIVVVEKLD